MENDTLKRIYTEILTLPPPGHAVTMSGNAPVRGEFFINFVYS